MKERLRRWLAMLLSVMMLMSNCMPATALAARGQQNSNQNWNQGVDDASPTLNIAAMLNESDSTVEARNYSYTVEQGLSVLIHGTNAGTGHKWNVEPKSGLDFLSYFEGNKSMPYYKANSVGEYTVTHSYVDNRKTKTETFKVHVIEKSSELTTVYVYVKLEGVSADNVSDGWLPGLVDENGTSWFTIGTIRLDLSDCKQDGSNQLKKISKDTRNAALKSIVTYDRHSIDFIDAGLLSKVTWTDLFLSKIGATDYNPDWASWHLDGKINISQPSYTVRYIDIDTGENIRETLTYTSENHPGLKWGSKIDPKATKKDFTAYGYEYVKTTPSSEKFKLTVDKSTITHYYRRKTQEITVKFAYQTYEDDSASSVVYKVDDSRTRKLVVSDYSSVEAVINALKGEGESYTQSDFHIPFGEKGTYSYKFNSTITSDEKPSSLKEGTEITLYYDRVLSETKFSDGINISETHNDAADAAIRQGETFIQTNYIGGAKDGTTKPGSVKYKWQQYNCIDLTFTNNETYPYIIHTVSATQDYGKSGAKDITVSNKTAFVDNAKGNSTVYVYLTPKVTIEYYVDGELKKTDDQNYTIDIEASGKKNSSIKTQFTTDPLPANTADKQYTGWKVNSENSATTIEGGKSGNSVKDYLPAGQNVIKLYATSKPMLTIEKTVSVLAGEKAPYAFKFTVKETGSSESKEAVATLGSDGKYTTSVQVENGKKYTVTETQYQYTDGGRWIALADVWTEQSGSFAKSTTIDTGNANTLKLSFANSRVTAPLKAQKTWENTAAGADLPGIKLPVKQNGTAIANTFITLNSSNLDSAAAGAGVVWKNANGPAVPVKDIATGEDYTYTIGEEAPVNSADQAKLDAYTVSVTAGSLKGSAIKDGFFSLKNTPKNAQLTVNKHWTGEPISGALTVTVQAVYNGSKVGTPVTVTVSKKSDNSWTGTETVPCFDTDGNELQYKVVSESNGTDTEMADYDKSFGDPVALVNGAYTLNIYNTKLALLTVTKEWNPTNSYNGDLYVKVKDNSGGNEQVLKLNSGNNWTASKYVPSTSNGQRLTYKFDGEYTDESCTTELTGYALSGTTKAILDNNTYSFNLKNTKQAQLTISKTVNKLDGEAYPYSFLFKVTGVAEPVEVTIGEDGTGSTKITVADTGSDIKVTETGYKYESDSDAMALTDIWQAVGGVEKTAVKDGDAYSVAFTNSRVTAPLKAQKTWENTAAGATLPGIVLHVGRGDAQTEYTTITISNPNDGNLIWKNTNGPAVPVKNVETGTEYTYKVLSETAADGSSLGAYDFSKQTEKLTGTELKGGSAFAVTNKLARVPLTVNKSWTGEPISGNLTVTVMAVCNGIDVERSSATVTVSKQSDGTWSGTTTVPCYDSEGHLLQYKVVSESNGNDTEMADYDKNYGSTVELSANKTYTLDINNTKLALLTVTKSWTPGADQTDADRPANLYVRVQGYAGETSVGAPVDLTLNDGNRWTASKYVPSTSNKQPLTYKLVGEYTDKSCTTALTGYVLSGTTEASLSNNEYILTPINTKQAQLTISKTVNKPAAMAYPESFTFTVTNSSNDQDKQSVTLYEKNDGEYALAAGSAWPTVLVGQSYTVAETVDTSIWDVAVDRAAGTTKTVKIIDGTNTVSFVNTRKTLDNNISITKNVENYNAAYMGEDSFTIRLTLPAEMTEGAALNVTGPAGTQSVTVEDDDSGKYVEFALKYGETVTISKGQLPTGTYSVAEQNVIDGKVSGDHSQVEYAVTNPTAPVDGIYTVTNTAQAGSLTLTKEVNDSEYTAEKTFKLTVAGTTDAQKNALSSLVTAQNGYTYANGVLTVPVTVPTTQVGGKLKASVTLDKIPAGKYTVSEENDNEYTVDISYNGVVEVTAGGTASATVTNTASGTRSIKVTKTWEIPSYVAANDYAAAVTLKLQRKNATDSSFLDVKPELELKSTAPTQAEATWPDLPTHDVNGNLYTYRVVESYTSGDSSKYNVTVGDETLTATDGVYARELGASDTAVTFKNSYKLAGANLLHVSKTVVDNTVMSGSNADRAFTVQITRGSNALSNVNCTINGTETTLYTTLDADGKATLRNGETLVITDALALGSYTVTEVFDDSVAKVWQGSEYNHSGSVTLDAGTTAAQTVALKNVREGVTIHGAKKWDASFADETPAVTLSLYAKAGNQYVKFGADGSMTLVNTETACKTDTIAANNQSVHAYSFNGNYPKYTDDGAEITYTVKETMAANADLYTAASGSIDTYDGTSLTNTRKTTAAKLSITKQIEPSNAVPTGAADDTFSFTIGLPGDVKEGTVIQYTKGNSETGTATADANHSIVINRIKNNDAVTLTGIVVNGTATYLPTGTYTVSESQTDGNTYTYSCGIFNGDSAVPAVTLGSSDISLTAKNTVQTGSVKVYKKWVQPNGDPAMKPWTPNDPDTGVIATFELKDGTTVLETQNLNANEGTVTFVNVPKNSSKTYTISETWHNQSAYYETVSQDTVSVRWNDNSNTFEFLDGSTVDNTKNTIVNKLNTTRVTVTKQIDWNGTAAENITSPFKLRVRYTDRNTGTAYDDTYDVTYTTSATGGTYTYKKGNTTLATNGIELTVPFGTEVTVSESFTGNQGNAWTPSYDPAGGMVAANDATNNSLVVTNTRKLVSSILPDRPGEIEVTKAWKFSDGTAIDKTLFTADLKAVLVKGESEFMEQPITQTTDGTLKATFTNVPAADPNTGAPYTYTVKEKIGDGAAVGDDRVLTVTKGTGDSGYTLTYGVTVVGYAITNTLKDGLAADARKRASVDTANLGDTVTYTVSRKSHLGKASTATIVDILPGGLDFKAGSARITVKDASGATVTGAVGSTVPAESGKTLTWNGIAVPAFGEVVLTYEATVNATAVTKGAGVHTNSATVWFDDETDGKMATATVKTPVLSIDKKITNLTMDAAGKYIVRTGDTVEYTITVKNSGEADAEKVVVSDPLPAGLTAEGVKINGVEATGTNNQYTLESIAMNNGTATIVITAKVTAKTGDIDGNVAAIAKENGKEISDLSDNTEELVISNPKLTITKVVDDTETGALSGAEFKFTLKENGEDVTGLKTEDGKDFDGTFSLKAGESFTISIPRGIYTLEEDIKDEVWTYTLLNSAETEIDTIEIPQSAVDTTTVAVTAKNARKLYNGDGELAVTKLWHEANGSELGEDFIPESITVQLYCNDDAVEGKTLTLPGTDGWRGSFTDLPAADANGNAYTYTVKEADADANGMLEAGGYTFKSEADESVKDDMVVGYEITNTLQNKGTAPVTEKTADEDEVKIGDTITYTISHTNPYASTTTTVVTDTLPKGVVPDGKETVSVNGTALASGAYTRTLANGDLTWTIENVPPYGSVEVEFTAQVTEDALVESALTNTASVGHNDSKATYETSEGKTETDVVRMAIEKTLVAKNPTYRWGAMRTTYMIGEKIEYQITVTNEGSVPFKSLELEDTLTSPANKTGKTVTYTFDQPLNPGETATLTYTYTVSAQDVLPAGERHYVDNVVSATGKTEKGTELSAESEVVRAEAEHYVRVRFIDNMNGALLKEVTIPYGGSTTQPDKVNTYEGYDFEGWWGGVWKNVTTDQTIFTNYVRREGWYPARTDADGTTILDAEIPLAGGYISNVGDCFD